jgi:secreted PhoX family phosphatase
LSENRRRGAREAGRRALLKGLFGAALLPPIDPVLSRLAWPEGSLAPQAPLVEASPFARFDPIAASDADDVVLPDGFTYDVVLKWGDVFTAAGRPFGYNNDFIGVFALGGPEEALLVVNHEYVSLAYAGDAALYPQTFEMLRGRKPTVADYKMDVGVSVVRVRRDGVTGAWVPVLGDPLNRRIDAHTACHFDGPAALLIDQEVIEGTFDNCSGQVTPWGTALSCEENYQARVPELVDAKGRSVRGGSFDLPGGHYGWVVEVDPYDPGSTPVKHTALGRFRHENVGLRAEAGKPLAGYMGDDRIRGHVWKFVSDGLYRPGDSAGNRTLLSSGTLYAARFNPDGTGEWRPLTLESRLDPNREEADQKPFISPRARTLADCYESMGAIVTDAYPAANAVGATPTGRPEDLEVHPTDGSVYIAFTGAAARGGMWENIYGQVWRLEEENGDVRSRRFRWTRFAAGGPADPVKGGQPFAQPDNLAFDARGDLWIASDIAGDVINDREDYRVFKNAGVFRVPVTGAGRGAPGLFVSMPCEAEPTGPAFAPGEQALFLSVQHPGERYATRTDALAAPRGSNWPHRKVGAPPQPAVVAIRRKP